MMAFGSFTKNKSSIMVFTPEINVLFFRNDPSSGALVIYNNMQRSITDVDITIENDSMENFHYHIDRIAYRTGERMEYSDTPDLSGYIFSGSIHAVELKHATKSYRFVFTSHKFRVVGR